MRHPRGFSAGTVLVLGFVCLAIAFVVACLCTFQLNAASRVQNSEQAVHLAEGAIALTVSHIYDGLVNNTPYGLAREQVVFQPEPDAPDHQGQVTFDPASPWGWSTANYDGQHASGWNNGVIPKAAVLVVARGVVGSATRIIEAVVAVPQFQYVLATDGPLLCTAPLNVKSEPSMLALSQDPNLTNASAANVGSNVSIQAESGSYVSGDVVCSDASRISLNAPSTVLGTVRQGQITTPVIPVTNYDNSAVAQPLSGTVPGITVQTSTYSGGSLTVNGDLLMANATLYVKGNLSVTGALKGTGAVFVDGQVTVNGGADLNATDLVALMATGNVTLKGTPGQAKYFQGLVYTEGAFSASDITIAGAFVASSSNSSITLGANTQVVYVQDAVTIQPPPGGAGPPTNLQSLVMGIDVIAWLPTGPQSYSNFNQLPPGGFMVDQMTPTQPSNPACYNAITAGLASNPVAQQWSQSAPNPINITGLSIGPPPWANMWVHAVEYNAASQKFVPVTPVQVVYDPDQATFEAKLGGSALPTVAMLTQAQTIFMNTANPLLQGSTGVGTPTSGPYPDLNLNNFLADKQPVRITVWRQL